MKSQLNDQAWEKRREYSPEKFALARIILEEIQTGQSVSEAVRHHPIPQGGHIGKHMLVTVYRKLTESGEWPQDLALLAKIRLKPVRTLSGVTTVTVLTKPYPCPGKCIFCPDDVRMPKSYLPDEPGAMRAFQHNFDPFNQVTARIQALNAVGHPIDKIELLILGGTWSSYSHNYQEWFIHRCLDALNKVETINLESSQSTNETANHRCVGLVVETRPDQINQKEIARLRWLGVTKVQMGAQSFDDRILTINERGHSVEETRAAVALLRAAGFKIVLHWMPNLLGATVDSDRIDFKQMWNDFCPDEIKIYPTLLLKGTKLYDYWSRNEYQPYTTEELIDLIVDIKPSIPRYCRVNRIVRDIPSPHVVEGNKRTSLRQDIHKEMKHRKTICQCVRCREVRSDSIDTEVLVFNDFEYTAGGAQERFLSYSTPDDKLTGFLRLSLPGENSPETGLHDLEGAAIIREVHVYGQSLQIGVDSGGAAQHMGLGTRLISEAEKIASKKEFKRMAVISAIGTRLYYLGRGYSRGDLYLLKDLD